MGYSKGWIEKNMGISRKTLISYERKGFIKPTRNSGSIARRIWRRFGRLRLM